MYQNSPKFKLRNHYDSQLIFHKGVKNTEWGKNRLFNEWCLPHTWR